MENKKNKPSKDKKTEFIIPEKGSIGLLALGAVGLKAWRKVRREAILKKNQKNNS
ncbi:MAG: hypothetical protein U9R42_01055 [Bacteroidota bacterium]|nr:hypothetical protein [Bacteroidota bacterium]